jgi:hypothetical protein
MTGKLSPFALLCVHIIIIIVSRKMNFGYKTRCTNDRADEYKELAQYV